jgi:hypothetical protein
MLPWEKQEAMHRTQRQRIGLQNEPDTSGTNRISVGFSMQYANELSQVESKPMISCYLSQPVKGPVLEILVPEDDPDTKTRVVLDAIINSGTALPKDTQVVFYGTCVRKNEFGVECRVSAGIGTVALTDLVEAGVKNAPIDVTLRMPSADWIEKGKLRIHAGSRDVKIDARIRWETVGAEWRRVGQQQREQEQTPQERERIEYINKVRGGETTFWLSCCLTII